ncbi:hypothetical protein BJX68DRAFT_77304 [Aspergillus pseudodeflectus]|uniref:Nucleoside phosphorylase domain-containing protein n=1 Tax=Aspergillus pseudodeflectus TaxID=176178 RepID=A0ABR4L6R7_9EURO
MSSSTIRLTHDAYRVGWISALPLEMAAAIAMLDASHAPLSQPEGDHNTYHLGEIGDHNIVIACLPTGIYGLTSAAVVAQQMLSTFPSIDIGLMVGIGGGVPSLAADVRLGDIVVSKPTGQFPGIIQYDYGKTVADGSFHRTGSLNNPPERLLTAISDLQAKHQMGDNNIALHLSAAARSRPSMQTSFVYPGVSEDILFESSYGHEADQSSCTACDKARIVSRPERDSNVPSIYYGLIASANQVMKDAVTRDRLGEELGILCFEMEAAGLMNHFPCLVIRGICDYSDSHKNKQWQDYAAGTAAGYARELLKSSVPSTATLPKRDDVIRIRSKIPISKSVFFGREAELEHLRQALDITQPARQFAVVWGLSGYGKTQLAIEYLTSRDDNYDSIIWIDSSSRGMAEESFEQISLRLGPPTNPQQSGAERVIEWLEQDANRSWIIVFDGVESLDDSDQIGSFDIRDYFPSCKHGHFLLVTTSPDLHLRLAFLGIQVQGVDDQTGAKILLRCAGTRFPDSTSHELAMTISRKLGGMPLAIEQAGSYLSYGLTSIRDYSKNFQIRFMDRTLRTPMKKYVGSYEKGRTLWTTFDMLYEALQRRNPDSARMLQLIAFLGRGAIPFTTIIGNHEDQRGIFQATASQSQPDDRLSPLASWLVELRAEYIALAAVVEQLESSGFVKFHRKEGDTIIESLVLHDLARSFLQSKVSPDETVNMVATSFLLNGWHLYDGTQIPEQNVIRRHMGRLLVVLDQFLSKVPNAMLQPPDGQYFRLCASVAPLYARICRYSKRLDTAAKLWALVLQHSASYDAKGICRPNRHHEDLMEAAEVDSRLGNIADAIDKYSAVLSFFESSNREADGMCIKAAGLLRESRERFQQRERNSGRAIAAISAPKNMRRDRIDEGEEGSESQSQEEYEEEEEEDEEKLRAAYMQNCQHDVTAAFESAQKLRDYYHRRNRPKQEAQYAEMLWKYSEAEHGADGRASTSAFRYACDCYYEAGELATRIVGDLHFALAWAKEFGSDALVELMSSKSALAVLKSLALGELDTIVKLVTLGEMDTALCWASLQPPAACDKFLQYLTRHDCFERGPLLLEVARRNWSGKVIKILLDIGTDVDYFDWFGYSALLYAASAGNTPGASVLLSHGADVYHKNKMGDTAMHLAVTRPGNCPVLEMLLAHGAPISQLDANGRTPLLIASALGNDGVISTLLGLGATQWETDRQGRTALHFAVKDRVHSGTFIVEILLQNLQQGALIAQRDIFAQTVFHRAAAHHEGCTAPTLHADIVRLLINYYQNEVERSLGLLETVAQVLDIQDCEGRTALHEAAKVRNRDVYNVLVHAGANPEIMDYSGVSAAFEGESTDKDEPSSPVLQDIRHDRGHGNLSRAEQRSGVSELSRSASGNDDDSNDQSHEQPANQASSNVPRRRILLL